MELSNESETAESKTLKYKNMYISGTPWASSNASKNSSSLENLDKFLELEKSNNSNEPWSKMDKTMKLKKLMIFGEVYKTENNLNDIEYNSLIAFFKDCLSRKKLGRVKDVNYDKTTGMIKDIPALYFNKNQNNFSLKNIDKRSSTIKNLAPKKNNGTLKNINNADDSEDEN